MVAQPLSLEFENIINTKRCPSCGEIKPLTTEFFTRKTASKDGFNNKCKFCSYNQEKIWRQNNSEKKREWAKNNKEKLRQYSRKWDSTHKEKIQQHRLLDKYCNPEKSPVRSANYYAKKSNLGANLTAAQYKYCVYYFGNVCAFCCRKHPYLPLTLEHWIAIKDRRLGNPGSVVTNVVPACMDCNKSKSNKDPYKWIRSIWPEQEANEIIARIEAYFAHVKELYGL